MLQFIRLEAVNPARNVRRFYEVAVTRDLLDDLVVTIRNGRIGCRRGQERTIIAASEADAARIVAQQLRRRASAPRRIGAEYRVVGKAS